MKFKPGKIVSVEVSSLGDESDTEERKELIQTMDRDGAALKMVRQTACGRKPTQSCRKVPCFDFIGPHGMDASGCRAFEERYTPAVYNNFPWPEVGEFSRVEGES